MTAKVIISPSPVNISPSLDYRMDIHTDTVLHLFPHMAIPRLRLPPPVAAHHHPSPAPARPPSLSTNFPTTTTTTTTTTRISSIQPLKAITKPDDTLSSMITELELDDDESTINEDHLPQQPGAGLADRWLEIHGRDDWTGLLDPMDPLLRSELIRYGEFAQACYDAFDYDPYSRYCGGAKHHRRNLLPALGMDSCGYEVTRYLYATSNLKLPNFAPKKMQSDRTWSEKASWIGFVAVSGDAATARLGRRDIAVAWRGTVTKLEWVADLMSFLRPLSAEGIPCPDKDAKVESGFMDLYTDRDENCRFCKYSAREQVLTEVKRLVELHTSAGEEVSVSVTGHSLGAALAVLSAYDVAETGVAGGGRSVNVPVCVFSFAGPRVGNGRFRRRFEEVGVKALRVVNVRDAVPRLPGILLNEEAPRWMRAAVEGMPWCYAHVGVELELDHRRSPFLKETMDPSASHNLEAHLHLLDGFHGRGERFKLVTGRDPALVNKASDFLKEHHMVPPYWRQDENKGMIRARDGRWVLPDRPKLVDDHPLDIHVHLQKLGLFVDQ